MFIYQFPKHVEHLANVLFEKVLLEEPSAFVWLRVIKTKRPLMMVDPRPIINSTPPSLSKVWLDRSESTRLDFFNIGSISNWYQCWKELPFYCHEFITKRLRYKGLMVVDNRKVISGSWNKSEKNQPVCLVAVFRPTHQLDAQMVSLVL